MKRLRDLAGTISRLYCDMALLVFILMVMISVGSISAALLCMILGLTATAGLLAGALIGGGAAIGLLRPRPKNTEG